MSNRLLRSREKDVELVLVPAGARKLTLEALEAACLARLARLVAETAIWRRDGYGAAWRVGDHNILIVETTVATDAVLYVQFWSEPEQPTLWEVSSANPQPGVDRFVTDESKRMLAEMGFEIGGKAGNLGKQVHVGNTGDAAAAARDVLRIFHGAFAYRGATALVARVMKGERSGRAVVHTRFEPDDVVTMLRHLGYEAEAKKDGERPLVLASQGGFGFAVTLDVPAHGGSFRCLDVTALVGHPDEDSHAAWAGAVNELNGRSRVARAWTDEDGDVIVGTSLMCGAGVTEDYIAEQLAGWLRAAVELAASQAGTGREEPGPGQRQGKEGEEGGHPGRRRRGGARRGSSEVVH